MTHEDFLDFKNHLSQGKDSFHPYLKDVSIVQFRKGCTKMYWKEEHGDTAFRSEEFIQKKHRSLNSTFLPVQGKSAPGAVTTSKLQDILKRIGPVIPVTKRRFLDNMPTNDDSPDLTVNYDHLASQEKDNSKVVQEKTTTKRIK